ncbi:unnamed protein product [Arabidopsis arenosa]|uniref:Uncharacterized protein n=1 Tax=Arabidopsis arenosa TaxID=38785 RepID=A0A8S1ZVQ9_ARAAE|nr:unnamed protein product [Arabidopsis arenosa]
MATVEVKQVALVAGENIEVTAVSESVPAPVTESEEPVEVTNKDLLIVETEKAPLETLTMVEEESKAEEVVEAKKEEEKKTEEAPVVVEEEKKPEAEEEKLTEVATVAAPVEKADE